MPKAEKIQQLKTGYFADPTKPEAEFPEVHAIEEDETPLCGRAVPEGHEYQWCSTSLWMPYVDCRDCQQAVHKMSLAQGLIRPDRVPPGRPYWVWS